jgi:alanyl-tRNA synthetase
MSTTMTCHEIRQAFTKYYTDKGHELINSSSLIPGNDPTLLFTNAGMVQFKEVFLGMKKEPYNKAVSVQRCVRAGGKHNDLENVGYTARHHTFFEMLGNFSFGDYFKREAIQFAWDFLTKELGIDSNKLWITVYKDDKESEDIWLKEMGVSSDRFSRCGEKDNFWQMGDVGPCGPCTEIFYDHGPDVAGGPPGSPEEDGDRYVEIWNLVFMQYNKDRAGELHPLPKPCVDTGMGLERIAAVLQGVVNNYDIDLFKFLLRALVDITRFKDTTHVSMRVLVDHIRASSFLVADGVTPANEGRGYVLRRIIRRAVRHGYKLGMKEPFFYRMVPALVSAMADAYPHMLTSQALIEQVIRSEEEQFFRTLLKGIKILDQSLAKLGGNTLPGDLIFTLYDTYGFPPDLTADIARERGLKMDMAGFEVCMGQQREQSQRSSSFGLNQTQHLHVMGETTFVGYDAEKSPAKVVALLQADKPIAELTAGQEGIVLINKTPFYAESGGQVGDKGYFYFKSGSFRVRDTQKQGDVYLHHGEVIKGRLQVGDELSAEVDRSRLDVSLNHTATHLMHEALRRVLGEHVQQKGSLVDAKRLRFDFSHSGAMTSDEISAVERLVNQQIRENHEAVTLEMSPEEAKKAGAIGLFGERYGKVIRVLRLGDFSMEICGGTHVETTGQIGLFKITSESACASGVRRIEAVTGGVALSYVVEQEALLNQLSSQLKSSVKNLLPRVTALVDESRAAQKELTALKQKMVGYQTDGLAGQVETISGVSVLAAAVDLTDRDAVRELLDRLKQKLKNAAIILATVEGGKVKLVSGVAKTVLPFFTASDLLKHVATQIDGRGGGRPDLAQGGGDNPAALPAALESVSAWVSEKVTTNIDDGR